MLSWLRALLSRRSPFAKNVARVSLGQIAASGISFLAIPIVARLYAPEQFGDVQLLLSMASSLAILGSLRYEMAIVLEPDAEGSNAVTVLCFCVVAIATAVLLGLMLLTGRAIFAFFNAESLVPYAALVALAILLGALLRVARFHLVSRERFTDYSVNNIFQVASTQTLSIGWGLVRPSFLGLFLSQMLGQLVSVVLAFVRAPLRLRGIRAGRLLALARRYGKFPTVNTPGMFVNSLGAELPVFMLARFFDAEVVGFYMLTTRLLSQPMLLLGQSVAQVYLKSASQAWSKDPASLLWLYRNTVKKLTLLGLLPATLVLVAAPFAVELVLGSQWAEVGRYMQILILLKLAQLVGTPVSTTFSVVDRQELGVAVMAVSTLARFGAMYWFSATPESMLLALSLTGTFFIVLYQGLIYWVLRRSRATAKAGFA